MKLPHRELSYVPEDKLTNYLLSLTHAVGRSKAAFFLSMGYTVENAGLLRRQLLDIADVGDVADMTSSPYGVKYAIDGILHTPVGRPVWVRTVWIIEPEDRRPRFVTAYPL